jgi:hypothetical protein
MLASISIILESSFCSNIIYYVFYFIIKLLWNFYFSELSFYIANYGVLAWPGEGYYEVCFLCNFSSFASRLLTDCCFLNFWMFLTYSANPISCLALAIISKLSGLFESLRSWFWLFSYNSAAATVFLRSPPSLF